MNSIKKLFILIPLFSLQIAQAQIELWGMTSKGGQHNSGTIFKYLPESNTHIVMHSFNDCVGQPRVNNLIKSSTGRFIGMSDFGGAFGVGTISEYNETANTFTTLYSFDYSSGNEPIGKLVEASNGKLYGVTKMGGQNDAGVLFSFDLSTNIFTKLIDLSQIDNGKFPTGPLVIDNGFIFGTTTYGGINGFGTLFKFDYTTNAFSKILDFNGSNNGKYPNSSLMKAANGKLYGDTKRGGTLDKGSIFEFDPINNNFSKKIDLDGLIIGDSLIGSMVQLADGMLYGISDFKAPTYSRVVFQYNPNTNILTRKANMGGNEFVAPTVGFTLGSDNKLYYYRFFSLYKYDYQQNSITETRLNDYGSIKNILIESSPGKLLLGVEYSISTANNELIEYSLSNNNFTSKYIFVKSENGTNPRGSLTLADDRKFYGTVLKGENSYGAIFCFDPKTNIYSKKIDFKESFRTPYKSLIQAKNGKMYGIAASGGQYNTGVIYSYDPTTNFLQKVYDLGGPNLFYQSYDKLLLANNGKLYGTILVSPNSAILFEFDPNTNIFAKKADFTNVIGLKPFGSLMQASNGKLYGLSFDNSTSSNGSIYEYTIGSTELQLKYAFDSIVRAFGSLTENDNGELFGLSIVGGDSNLGQIFYFNFLNNVFANKFSFSENSSGKYPIATLNKSIDKNLYGFLGNEYNNYGGIFKFNPITNAYSKLFEFNGQNGKFPDSNLTQRIATISTIKSGKWNDPTVWENGVVPSNTSYVTINSNHIIDIEGVPVAVKYVDLKGSINFLNGGSLNLVE
jgi:uncharacterized repeat protein (TIGR03803 family)